MVAAEGSRPTEFREREQVEVRAMRHRHAMGASLVHRVVSRARQSASVDARIPCWAALLKWNRRNALGERRASAWF